MIRHWLPGKRSTHCCLASRAGRRMPSIWKKASKPRGSPKTQRTSAPSLPPTSNCAVHPVSPGSRRNTFSTTTEPCRRSKQPCWQWASRAGLTAPYLAGASSMPIGFSSVSMKLWRVSSRKTWQSGSAGNLCRSSPPLSTPAAHSRTRIATVFSTIWCAAGTVTAGWCSHCPPTDGGAARCSIFW